MISASVRSLSGEAETIRISPTRSPPMPKMPWMRAPSVCTMTPSPGMVSAMFPDRYAVRLIGRGGWRTPTLPDTALIVSTRPVTGDLASDLNMPKKALVAAITCPFSTSSPSLTKSAPSNSSASMPSWAATLTDCIRPGREARATTVSGVTTWPV